MAEFTRTFLWGLFVWISEQGGAACPQDGAKFRPELETWAGNLYGE